MTLVRSLWVDDIAETDVHGSNRDARRNQCLRHKMAREPGHGKLRQPAGSQAGECAAEPGLLPFNCRIEVTRQHEVAARNNS
jgi:hypothetical protein